MSSRSQRWKRNFRCPDVAVFLPDNPAEDRKTHWFGGPDFAVEIQSPFDRSREKFGFYAKVGVACWMFVTCRPWAADFTPEPARVSSGQDRAKWNPSSWRARFFPSDFASCRGPTVPGLK